MKKSIVLGGGLIGSIHATCNVELASRQPCVVTMLGAPVASGMNEQMCKASGCCWDAGACFRENQRSDARQGPQMTDAKQLSQPLPLTNVGNIQNMITHNEVQLPDVSQIEQMRATACRRVVALDVDQQMKQTMFNKLQCTQDMINEQPLTENERASMMASLDVGDQSEASIAAASQLVAQKMKVMEAFKKQQETMQSIQSILIQKFTDRVKEENPELIGTTEADEFADMEPEERFKQMILTKILTDEVEDPEEPEDPGYYGERVTQLDEFLLPGEPLDYNVIDWEILQRCFNQRAVLKKTHNCYLKSPTAIFNKFSCLAEGCIYDGGDCFYCNAAHENQVENRKSLRWLKSNTDECTVIEEDKVPCPDFEETPLSSNKMKLLSLLDPKMNQFMTIVHIKKMEQQCESAGCCYQRDNTPIKRAMFAGENSISQLLAEKVIPDSDHLGCYKKAESTPMMTADRCMPKFEDKECGQHDNLPLNLGPEAIEEALSDEKTPKSWMVALATEGDITGPVLKCSGVLVCDSWLLTSQSCMRQHFSDSQPAIYIAPTDLTDLTTGTKSSAAEIVHHHLYEQAEYMSRAHVGNDITAIRLETKASQMPICLPKTTDTPIGKENNLIYTIGLGQRGLPSSTPNAVKIDKYATQANFKCVKSSRRVDFLGSLCLRHLDDEKYLPDSTAHYTTRNGAIAHGDRGGAGARYHKNEAAWVLDGIIAGGPSSLKASDAPAVLVHINENLSWIEDVTNGCCPMLDFML